MYDTSDLEKKILEETNEFMNFLERKTGVSQRFLKKAEPALQRLFADVPVENRGQCLETIFEIAERQAGNEKEIQKAREGLVLLTQTNERHDELLEELDAKLRRTEMSLASLQFGILLSQSPPQRHDA